MDYPGIYMIKQNEFIGGIFMITLMAHHFAAEDVYLTRSISERGIKSRICRKKEP